jgi:hypothetical protein
MHLTKTTSHKRMEVPYNGEQESSIQGPTLHSTSSSTGQSSFAATLENSMKCFTYEKVMMTKNNQVPHSPLHANHLVPTQVSSSSPKKSYQARKLVQDTCIFMRIMHDGLVPPTNVRSYPHRCSVCDHAH